MNLIKLSAIDSTNDYLKSILTEVNLDDLTVVWAEAQHQGRGQREATWHAKKDKSLTFSVLKRFKDQENTQPYHISMAVALAVLEVLNSYEIPKLTVKWPNDIMSDNQKLGGILIENQFRNAQLTSAIIGIGLNVGSWDIPAPHAASIEDVTGQLLDMDSLLRKIINAIEQHLGPAVLKNHRELKERYEACMFRRDVISQFALKSGKEFYGCIKGIGSQGSLVVELAPGLRKEFDIKEITYLL